MSYHIMCLDDEIRFLDNIKSYLNNHYRVTPVDTVEWALAVLKSDDVDLVLLDVELKGNNGIEVLKTIKEKYPNVEVLMLSGHREMQHIVDSIKNGAADYITKDAMPDEIIAYIEKTLNNKGLKDRYDALIQTYNHGSDVKFLGRTIAFRKVLEKASRLKGHNANVLIEGESGTGKELLARYLHQLEDQSRRPFIVVNCAAMPDNIVESELFGHEKGAFTGAISRKIGKFELADKGDIFLDEINSLKLELQGKLLRAMEEKEFYRIGSIKSISASFRVIAAANVNLYEMVLDGRFREDLYHRLHVIDLTMPPLRERKEDIPDLVKYYAYKFQQKIPKEDLKYFSEDALNIMIHYNWQGNIRELKNLVQNLVIMCDKQIIDANDLPGKMNRGKIKLNEQGMVLGGDVARAFMNSDVTLADLRKQIECHYAKRVVDQNKGNKSAAARVLGVSRMTLHNLLNKNNAVMN